MNTLSWILYLLDVYNGVLGAIIVVTVMSGIAAGVSTIVYFLTIERAFKSEEVTNDQTKYIAKRTIPIFIIASILAILLPAPKTMYAIVASELGEQVLMESDLPELKKVRDIINKKLDELNGD